MPRTHITQEKVERVVAAAMKAVGKEVRGVVVEGQRIEVLFIEPTEEGGSDGLNVKWGKK